MSIPVRAFHFRFTRWIVTDDGDFAKSEIPLVVEATTQPKAERIADTEYRQFVLNGKRPNWRHLRRDLVQVR